MTYWHFAARLDGEPVMRDGTPIEIGKRYAVPEARMCDVGFHGSRRAINALMYAPGPWVSKREILVTDTQKDKVVGTECVHIVGADAAEVLRKFGRMCALDVIDLWDPPPIVIKYLKTGDESLREASRAASREASREASWAAGSVASWAASRAASWKASRAASRAAGSVASSVAQNRRLTRMLNKLLRGV